MFTLLILVELLVIAVDNFFTQYSFNVPNSKYLLLFVPVPHNGSHIIMKNHSEFRFFFPRADETRKLPYHNKHAWLHKVR